MSGRHEGAPRGSVCPIFCSKDFPQAWRQFVLKYVIKRVLWMLFTLLVILAACFVCIKLLPPVRVQIL
jgi:hypothetical protein